MVGYPCYVGRLTVKHHCLVTHAAILSDISSLLRFPLIPLGSPSSCIIPISRMLMDENGVTYSIIIIHDFEYFLA